MTKQIAIHATTRSIVMVLQWWALEYFYTWAGLPYHLPLWFGAFFLVAYLIMWIVLELKFGSNSRSK